VTAEPTGSKVFMIAIGAALVGVGVSMWRNPARPEDIQFARSFWRGGFRPGVSPELKRAYAAVVVGLGLVMSVGMAIALFMDPS
jgi:hypothetical protein